MRFWRYLSYEFPFLVLQLLSFILVILVFATASPSSTVVGNALYGLALVLLVNAGFFIYRYFKTLQAVSRRTTDESPALSMEAAAYREELERMENAQIRSLNEVHNEQREHYDFIVSWFHEIKTPIAVLRLLQQTGMDPASLEEELNRIEHYVDQALYYAKLDSFNQDYELINCDLALFLKDVVKQHAKTFISKNIRLALKTDPIIVQTDRKWLQFIVNQIVTNSLKYTPHGGEIHIRTLVSEQEKMVVIEDSGIGIKQEDLPRIFNRGFSGANGRAHASSTGMGLFLAQELSKKLGHYLTCASQPGRGTSVTIHFPKHHDRLRNLFTQKES